MSKNDLWNRIRAAFSSLAPTFATVYLLNQRQDLYRQIKAESSARQRAEDDLQAQLESNAHLAIENQTLRAQIGECEQAEAARRASAELYSTLARNLQGAVLWFDCELRYTLAEGQGLGALGLPERVQGETPGELFSPEIYKLLEPAYRAALAGASAMFQVALANRSYEVNVVPVRNEHGAIPAGMMIMQDITARERAIENARMYERAQHLAAQEERQRLARELHDSVSQALYGIQLGATTAREMIDTDTGEQDFKSALHEPLDYVVSLADAGLAEMRALIFDLRPESLETEGLVAGLQKQIASLRARHGLAVEADLPEEPAVSLEVKETLYRIVQEALHNTVKHAQASQVNLQLRCGPDAILLEMNDDGKGFEANASYPGHLGLRSMHERAEQMGGDLNVESSPDSGTRIHVRIPLAPR